MITTTEYHDDNDNNNDNYKNEKINIIENEDNYKFTTNVNEPLARTLNINKFEINEINTWIPPNQSGLDNCNYIIPHYYYNDNTNYFNLDYYNIIKDDIRNMRPLNKYQIEYIKHLSDDKKNKLFEIFNDCLISISSMV